MPSPTLFFFFFFILLHLPPPSAANIHSTTTISRSYSPTSSLSPPSSSPTTFFQVTKPIQLPNTKPCSYLLLQHNFAYTYGKSPLLVNYSPPSDCPSHNFAKIVLQWTATCKGRQFDRIFGVWLGGVELLRSCTAEPRATGIVWTVKKDITRYTSLLMSGDQTLAVYLGNLVDSTYTGIYHVNLTIHFYPHPVNTYSPDTYENDNFADLLLPISRNLPLNDGLWFQIKNQTDVETKQFMIPQNVYKAVLEVYVSFHENDEFWYGNFPNDYIQDNNLTDYPGNGPFREVLVSLDGSVVGAVWPFTVIFTGGVNPLLWRPITAIGSFDLPTYDIEITPFLGKILDGKTHEFGFSVTNGLNVWYVNANLHLWLDKKSERTQGKLLEYHSLPLSLLSVSNFTGMDGSFVTNVSRTIVSSGWVKSSHGVINTKSVQGFKYSNSMVLGNNANMQIFDQMILVNASVYTELPSSSVESDKSLKKFLIHYDSDNVDKGHGTYASIANVTLGFNVKTRRTNEFGSSAERLKNLQKGQGYMLVKNNLVVSGLGSTQQVYRSSGYESCYFRNVSSSNYTILYDNEKDTCNLHGWWSFHHRGAVL